MGVSVPENVTRAGQSLSEQLLEHFHQERLPFWAGKSHHSSVTLWTHPKYPHQSCSDETMAPKPVPAAILVSDKGQAKEGSDTCREIWVEVRLE